MDLVYYLENISFIAKKDKNLKLKFNFKIFLTV